MNRRTASGGAGYGLGTTIKYLRGAADIGLGTTTKYLRRATSAAARNGLGTTIKYLLGAAGKGLGTSIKYLRRTTRQRPGRHDQVPATHNERRRGQRPGHHDQVSATHNERRRGQRPEPIPGITDVPIHHKRPAFAFLCACFRRQQAERPYSQYKKNTARIILAIGTLPVPYSCTEKKKSQRKLPI
jgi:hypothetical protein